MTSQHILHDCMASKCKQQAGSMFDLPTHYSTMLFRSHYLYAMPCDIPMTHNYSC